MGQHLDFSVPSYNQVVFESFNATAARDKSSSSEDGLFAGSFLSCVIFYWAKRI